MNYCHNMAMKYMNTNHVDMNDHPIEQFFSSSYWYKLDYLDNDQVNESRPCWNSLISL
jgi:hypothetical protein